MNVFIEFCENILTRIESKEMNFEAHLNHIQNSIREKLDRAERVVVCGNTKIGKNCMEYLARISESPAYMWDLRDKYTGGGITPMI